MGGTTHINQYKNMKRTAFRLKSQDSSFKEMGATPGESPAQLAGLLRWAWKGVRYGRKSKNAMKGQGKTVDDVFTKTTGKVQAKYGKTDIKNVVDDAVTKSKSGYGGGSPKTQVVKDIVTAGVVDQMTGGNILNTILPEIEVDGNKVNNNPDGERTEESKNRIRQGYKSDSTKTKNAPANSGPANSGINYND